MSKQFPDDPGRRHSDFPGQGDDPVEVLGDGLLPHRRPDCAVSCHEISRLSIFVHDEEERTKLHIILYIQLVLPLQHSGLKCLGSILQQLVRTVSKRI